jgi:hypothetical protein
MELSSSGDSLDKLILDQLKADNLGLVMIAVESCRSQVWNG